MDIEVTAPDCCSKGEDMSFAGQQLEEVILKLEHIEKRQDHFHTGFEKLEDVIVLFKIEMAKFSEILQHVVKNQDELADTSRRLTAVEMSKTHSDEGIKAMAETNKLAIQDLKEENKEQKSNIKKLEEITNTLNTRSNTFMWILAFIIPSVLGLIAALLLLLARKGIS